MQAFLVSVSRISCLLSPEPVTIPDLRHVSITCDCVMNDLTLGTVSYTHLTLPTKLSV